MAESSSETAILHGGQISDEIRALCLTTARAIGAVNAALELRGAREALGHDAFAAVRELLTATPEGRPS